MLTMSIGTAVGVAVALVALGGAIVNVVHASLAIRDCDKTLQAAREARAAAAAARFAATAAHACAASSAREAEIRLASFLLRSSAGDAGQYLH